VRGLLLNLEPGRGLRGREALSGRRESYRHVGNRESGVQVGGLRRELARRGDRRLRLGELGGRTRGGARVRDGDSRVTVRDSGGLHKRREREDKYWYFVLEWGY